MLLILETGDPLVIYHQTFSERRSYERRSERRSQFRERNVSGAHFLNYERKKSGAHVFLEERVMSAKIEKTHFWAQIKQISISTCTFLAYLS